MVSLAIKSEILDAQECRIVRISGGTGVQTDGLWIDPDVLMVPKGSCVIWINWVRKEDVTVKFEEGKKCQDVTDAPTGFSMNTEGCYVTSWIPLGGTSSLTFKEAGTYEYVAYTRLGYEAGGVIAKGKIVVR